MIKRVVITNYLGESMEYKIEGVQIENESGLLITSIEGLGPVKADITMSKLVTTDGDLFNMSRLNGRNIVIKALFTHASSVEEARLLSYKYFPIGTKVNVEVYTDNRVGETSGYVESNEPDIFSDSSGCQISVLCESPFFTGMEENASGGVFSEKMPLFKLPFKKDIANPDEIMFGEITTAHSGVVEYLGDSEPGCELCIEAIGDVKNPSIIKDGSHTISVDTSKMTNKVPNTSPTDLPYKKCSFTWDGTSYKFFKNTDDFGTEGSLGISAVFYDNRIHIFSYETGGKAVHVMWNGYSFEELPYPPKVSGLQLRVRYCVAYHDEIHVLCDYASNYRSHYKWKTGDSDWSLVRDNLPFYVSYGCAVVYHDAIHILGGGQSQYTTDDGHHIYDGSNWIQIGHVPVRIGSAAVVYKDHIHTIGGGTSTNSSKIHYVYDGSSWQEMDRLEFGVKYGAAVVFDNKIHFIGGFSNDEGSINYAIKHFTWNEHRVGDGLTDNWSEEPVLPFTYYDTDGDMRCVTDGNLIYLLGTEGGTETDTYTEEQNNIKLIEGDKLYISTIKTKKGVKLVREGNVYNVINCLDRDPDWFTLKRGDNGFEYFAESGVENIILSVYSQNLYEGM